MRYADSKKGTVPTEGEFRKLSSRNEELAKQEATLKKEYTTLLRKISSLSTVVMQLEERQHASDETVDHVSVIGQETLERVPDLKWYNEQIAIIEEVAKDSATFVVPDELTESYKLYRDTPLLHRDAQ
ncbi:hypothetical protein HG535_0A08040 [Zygotorulaspora mrakii]|uniref:Uncharacterized protein n=1 Tax=Zygotorulaspora mrakii TaxID=42260 RepID=A0A7H9AYL0_ZYGMR|nr:uncharacterized protein HG535_0A08040 [Zygotorulaspora mrakii]QLG70859.1 hypothetical protein HG535_0A08040 [Zygotorulaspora mrakii]